MTQRRNEIYEIQNKEVPRSLFPSGRLKFSLRVPGGTPEADDRRRRMDDLRENFAWDVLHAIQKGRLGIAEVCTRMQQGGRRAIKEIQHELEASAAAAKASAEATEPLPMPSFGEQVDKFLAAYRKKREPHSYSTVSSRLKGWKNHVRNDGTVLRDVPFNEIVSSDARAYLNQYSNPNTREGYRLALSGLYTWSIKVEEEAAAVEKRLPRWTRNPAARIEAVRKSKRVRIPTDEEVGALLQVAEPYQEGYLRPIIHLGLRDGELIHTRYGLDLDLDRWLWKICDHPKDDRCNCLQCRPPTEGSDKVEGWTPKNSNGYRVLHLPERPAGLRRAILRMLAMYPVDRGDYVFRNPRTGRIWVVRSLQEDFAALCKRAGVMYGRENGIVLHDLRHVCATNLVRSGVDVVRVANILGDTVKTVVDTYVNLDAYDLGQSVSQGPAYDTEEEEQDDEV